jgi:tetratricopeptide (TPR) repeat protein
LAEAQQDDASLHWAHWGLGRIRLARDDLAEALVELSEAEQKLAEAYPGNTGWQRNLSISYGRIGDILLELDRLPEATDSFEDRLAIAERLAATDPSNALWQADLAISHGRFALARSKRVETRQALDGFRKARGIIARLRGQSPGDASLPSLDWYDSQIAKIEAAGVAAPENAP